MRFGTLQFAPDTSVAQRRRWRWTAVACLIAIVAVVGATILVIAKRWAPSRERDETIAQWDRLIALEPGAPLHRATRAILYFRQGEFDKATADMLEAIRLNPGDVGADYEPSTNRELPAAALRHGEEQVRRMLADRPAMAEHVTEGDALWTWAVRKFAGEDRQGLVDWDPSDPSPFEAHSTPSFAGRHASICVRDLPKDSPPRRANAFELLWSSAVFELHNIAATKEFERVEQMVADGKMGREAFIVAMCKVEELSKSRTRAFYVKCFVPWLRSKELDETFPEEWYCLEFDAHESGLGYWIPQAHMEYFSAWFDLLCIGRDYKQGKYDEVARRLDTLESRADTLASHQLAGMHYWRGYLLWARRDVEGAVKQFNAVLAIDLSSLDAMVARATLWAEQGQREKALAEVNEVLRRDPEYVDALAARANYYESQGDEDAALADLASALAIEPENTDIHGHRGSMWVNRGEYDKALRDFSEIVRIAPDNADGYHSRAQVQMAKGNWEQALVDLDTAIRLDPRHPAAYYDRANAYLQNGQYQKAWADFSQIIKLHPNRPEGYAMRAECSMRWKDGPEPDHTAVQDARRSCELTNWQIAYYVTLLAKAYARSGDVKRAFEWAARTRQLQTADSPR